MISKAQIKIIQSLYQKKYRKQHNLFIVEGVKLTNELILSELNIHSIFATNEWISQNTNNETLKEFHYNINEISDEELKKISSLKTPNQVLALAQINDGIFDNKEENILLLDSIRNPGNLGTIIRIADWYNIKQIICSPDCVDVYNPKVV
ncbi:MAG: TrmH family RNA methyltransferase, partial [Bacteroidota bacterium]|nr:TrmH family RNA methyltransferase [Bacteroidota bacterium]